MLNHVVSFPTTLVLIRASDRKSTRADPGSTFVLQHQCPVPLKGIGVRTAPECDSASPCVLQPKRPVTHKGVGCRPPGRPPARPAYSDPTAPVYVRASESRRPGGPSRAGRRAPRRSHSIRRGLDGLSSSDCPRPVMRFHGGWALVGRPMRGAVTWSVPPPATLGRVPRTVARLTCRYPYVCVARLEDDPSSRARVRVVGASEGRAPRLRAGHPRGVRTGTGGTCRSGTVDASKKLWLCAGGQISSRCLIPFLETLASVISSGIQSGLSSGASSSHAHPS